MIHPANRYPTTLLTTVALVSALALSAGSVVASAQLSRLSPAAGPSTPLVGGLIRGTDVGFDPVHDVYLVVGGSGELFGVFVNAFGNPVSGIFPIPGGGYMPRLKYSQEINGGQGGFLVVWHGGPVLYSLLVAYPVGIISGPVPLSDVATFVEQGAGLAYSPPSRRFLVTWTAGDFSVRARLVDPNGTPLGGVIFIDGGAHFSSAAWNLATNEFGVGYSGFTSNAAFAAFRRLNAASGAVSGRETFGFSTGTYATGIDVNTATGGYVMSWWSGSTQGILIHPNGTTLATGLVMTAHAGQDNLGLAYNPASGTFLVGGSYAGDFPEPSVVGVELNANGAAISAPTQLTSGAARGSFYPRVAARTNAPQWNISFSINYGTMANQIVSTTSVNGGAPGWLGGPPPDGSGSGGGGNPGGCTTPDPFVSIGGGTCVNGGWIPGGSGGGGGNPGGCTTPDPFVSIGGGTCVNGGWTPGGSGGGSGNPGGCTTPDPFVSIGGGTCVNGGWTPGGSGGGGGGNPGGCTTPDPFVSIGGGTCRNGGWTPGGGGGGGGNPGGCTTPDPFVSIGGGTCVNGGWIPGGSGGGGGNPGGCTTPDPFVSIGGGVCQNGGWTPRPAGGSSCSTPDPFVSIGGGICLNGGWTPRGS
jgi:hypothetical protein